jgi:hypothetical protein
MARIGAGSAKPEQISCDVPLPMNSKASLFSALFFVLVTHIRHLTLASPPSLTPSHNLSVALEILRSRCWQLDSLFARASPAYFCETTTSAAASRTPSLDDLGY